jgi:Ca2+-binding RTX toxin-like protein
LFRSCRGTIVIARKQRVRAAAALFATAALFLVRGVHAAVQAPPACTITGTPGPDLLLGPHGRDVICGLGGNDVLGGSDGDDVLEGGPGRDTLGGGNGGDRLYGGPGSDKLQGDHGRDAVYAGPGNDTIFAWDGFADRLDGGLGTDRAWRDKLDRVVRVERFG